MFDGIGEVLYFVADPEAAEAWYSRVAGVEAQSPRVLRLGRDAIVFHLADDKMPAGAAGQVAYPRVADFDAARARVEEMGGTLYRGPLERPDRKRMAQFRDPFGNLLGLVG